MDLLNVWTVAAKDFSMFFKKRSIELSIILLPLTVSIGLPGIIMIVVSRDVPSSALAPLIYAFSFFFVQSKKPLNFSSPPQQQILKFSLENVLLHFSHP